LQHCALASHIQELGNICTIIIKKKKESSNKLLNGNIAPQSLTVKCELTTSPAYENNPDFLAFQQELHEIVNNFTSQSLNVMKKWSLIIMQLLMKDRCSNILKKALSI
jgi:hypothetical protein